MVEPIKEKVFVAHTDPMQGKEMPVEGKTSIPGTGAPQSHTDQIRNPKPGALRRFIDIALKIPKLLLAVPAYAVFAPVIFVILKANKSIEKSWSDFPAMYKNMFKEIYISIMNREHKS